MRLGEGGNTIQNYKITKQEQTYKNQKYQGFYEQTNKWKFKKFSLFIKHKLLQVVRLLFIVIVYYLL